MPANQWSPELIQQCEAYTGLPLLRDETTLGLVKQDFGQLNEGMSQGVAIPQTQRQLERLMAFAYHHWLPVTPRGAGLCQGGQSIPDKGAVSVVLTELDHIDPPDFQTLTLNCQGGCTWGQLLATCLSHGLAPYATLANVDITLGGTLSVGGISSLSHRYGPVVSNVDSMDILTSWGESRHCDRHTHSELFEASLGGLGAFGIIQKAQLSLRQFQPYTRCYILLYDDLQACLQDQIRLAKAEICDHIEVLGAPCVPGTRIRNHQREPFAHWFYALHLGFEFTEPHAPPQPLNALSQCRYFKCVDVSDTTTTEFFKRYQLRFKKMQITGAWQQAHPWLDYLIDADTLQSVLPAIMNYELPLAVAECRMMPVNATNKPRLFKTPKTNKLIAFAILPQGVAEFAQSSALEALKSIHQRLISAGAKRYLSGWLTEDATEQNWQAHYEEDYAFFQWAKRQFDPRSIITSKALSNVGYAATTE